MFGAIQHLLYSFVRVLFPPPPVIVSSEPNPPIRSEYNLRRRKVVNYLETPDE